MSNADSAAAGTPARQTNLWKVLNGIHNTLRAAVDEGPRPMLKSRLQAALKQTERLIGQVVEGEIKETR